MIKVGKFLMGWGLNGDGRAKGMALSDAALTSFPAPVFQVLPNGTILNINTAAKALREAVDIATVPAVSAAIGRATTSGRSQVDAALIPTAAGSLLYELNVMPLAQGGLLILAKDVTLESNLRSALVESRQRYKDLVEISTEFAWEVGVDGKFTFVTPRGALGHSPEQLVGHEPAEFFVETPGVDNLLPFASDKPVDNAEVWMRRQDGSVACLLTSSSPLLDGFDQRRGARGICRDVTRERERDADLARADNRDRLLNYIIRTVRDVVEPSDLLTAAAEAIARALGAGGCDILRYFSSDFQKGASFGDIGDPSSIVAAFSVEDRPESVVEGRQVLAIVTRYRHEVNGGIVLWRPTGALPWSEEERLLLDDVASQIGIANEQIANHERILALSRTDSLTGLFNRRAFFEELSRRFTRLAWDERPASLIYVDLDNFKLVNDVFGHRRGDEALLAVRDILLRYTRPNDLLARLGGDEFALWLEGAGVDIARRRCEELITAANTFAHYSGDPASPLTMSMGVAVHDPAQPESLNDLLARADDAMYAAKREGKCSFRVAGEVVEPPQ